MTFTQDQLNEILKRPAIARRNQVGVTELPAVDKKPAKRRTLEHRVSGKETSGPRFEIVFTVYATKPADWDGYSVKELQDLLVRAGILPDDSWRTLEGRVRSAKAERKEDCRTEVTIERIGSGLL